MKRVLLLAGEESGLIYARRLRALMPDAEVRGYEDYGFKTADLAVMGFVPVLMRLFFFLRVKRTMERAIDEWHPDMVVTVDYPGMNLKLAAYAKARNIRAVHVVCPQVWAWKKGRIPKIEASLDRLCCFFPFEPQYFKPGFAEFIGHPLVAEFPNTKERKFEKGLVALLPGSRIGEIEKNLPTIIAALEKLPTGVRAIIPAAHEGARVAIEKVLRRRASGDAMRASGDTVRASGDTVRASGDTVRASVILGGARELLMRADCAVVASGTATLEAALARCPTVLVYRVSAALAWFARKVIKEIRHIGLANIIWEKTGEKGGEPMPELLQEAFTPDAVAAKLAEWLDNPDARAEAVARLDAVARSLATEGEPLAKVLQ